MNSVTKVEIKGTVQQTVVKSTLLGYNNQGAEGPSAYEIAVAEGYVGTKEEWIASLQGVDGIQGIQGETGETGIQGETGETGASITSAEFNSDDMVFTKDDTSTVTLTDAKITLKGDKGLNWKGTYDSVTAYVVDDAVQFAGSMYVCIINVTGETPTTLTSWELMVNTDIAGDTLPIDAIIDYDGLTVPEGWEEITDEKSSLGIPKVLYEGRIIIPIGNNILSTETIEEYNYQQGFCMTSETTAIRLNKKADGDVKLIEFNIETGVESRNIVITNTGHSNSIIYDGTYLYVTPYNTQTIIKINYSTLATVETYTLDIDTKYIGFDRENSKYYIGNNVSMYEWDKDLTTYTKLFDVVIPDFINQTTGMLQDICVYNNKICLLTSCYDNTKVILFEFDFNGNIKNTYDLGTNNDYMYYGEGEAIDNWGEDFHFMTIFSASTYNDYYVITLNKINLYDNLFINEEYNAKTSFIDRNINSASTNFKANGNEDYPYRYYFEHIIANLFNAFKLMGNINTGNQPRLRVIYDRCNFQIGAGITIEGLSIEKSICYFQGNATSIIKDVNNEVTGDYHVNINNSTVQIKYGIIGDGTLNGIYAEGSNVTVNDVTFNVADNEYELKNSISNLKEFALLNLSSNLSIASGSGVPSTIDWNTATNDTSSFWNSSNPERLTIPDELAGKTVIITAGIRWDSNSTGGRFTLLRKNGSLETAMDISTVNTVYSRGYTNLTKTFYNVSSGDYFDIQVSQTSGSSLNITTDPRTFMQIAVL